MFAFIFITGLATIAATLLSAAERLRKPKNDGEYWHDRFSGWK